MVLPASVNKATGLSAALEELELSPQDVVGVGDAENDEAFLAMCGCGVAVANALDSLKAVATHVTAGENGVGVQEVIESMISAPP
jgi:hydroxymethylpyrimidine pyrophosphatase-like HAD family hydrolase